MKKALVLFALTTLVACAATKLVTPTQADVDRGSKKIPGLTLEKLMAGKHDFETTCSKCHKLKNPASRTEAQWREVVPKMAGKAQRKFGTDVIDTKLQESILSYLITMGKPD